MEGKEKVEDHVMALKLLCGTERATGAVGFETDNTVYHVDYGEEIRFSSKGYRKPLGLFKILFKERVLTFGD